MGCIVPIFLIPGGLPTETPPPPLDRKTLDGDLHPDGDLAGQSPPEGTWGQAVRQEVTSYRDPPP